MMDLFRFPKPHPGPRVVVVGGGIIGLSTAWRLSQRGAGVILLEQDLPGAGASCAAAGMLSVAGEADRPDSPLLALCRAGRARWHDFAGDLEAAGGHAIDMREQGTLLVAEDPSAAERLQALSELPGAALARKLTPAEAQALEPGLAPAPHGVFFAPQDGLVDNRAAVHALSVVCRRSGVIVSAATPAIRILVVNGRVRGITSRAGTIEADAVVVAAGMGTNALLAASDLAWLAPPVRPVKGEMLALRMDPAAPLLHHVVRGERHYLVPRSSGRLVLGATSEPGVGETRLTFAGMQDLLRGAMAILPGLGALPVIEHWAGVRPLIGDGSPIIGPSAVDGLVLAIGHYRNGVLLASITADLVAGALMGSLTPDQDELIQPFLPAAVAKAGENCGRTAQVIAP